MWKYCLLITCLFGAGPILAQTANDWLDKGMQAYERMQYLEARDALESFLRENGDSKKISLPLAVCYYETSELDKAYSILSTLINEPKDPSALFYYAQVLHSRGNYAEAAEYYKKYLPFSEQPANIKKQILHCRSGITLSAEKSLAFIDNMGEQINTPYDELGPVISPNHPGRIYYSSASAKSEGGKRDPNGYVNEEFGTYTFDMFKVENQNGSYTEPQALNPELNTARNELLYGFTGSGRVAFFFRGFNLKFGEIVTDTFRAESSPSIDKKNVFNSPADATYGDKDLHFINDSAFIFASVREGGMGGYDLYLSKWEDGMWTEPESLGPEVNSPFHERCPFLDQTGNQIFFSSDRPESMGGFDVFVAGWSNNKFKPAVNLGKGVNSAGDDLFFIKGHDRFSAFFSSDRKTGLGGFDIYSAYFKESLEEITQSSGLSPLYSKVDKENVNPSSVKLPEKEIVKVSALLFSNESESLTADHKESLNKVAGILSMHPQVELNILSFTAYEGPKKYDLYFALKRAETVGQYLIQQGISGDRLYITACGSSYPVYIKLSETQMDPSPNQRIDFRFSSGMGELPFNINYDAKVPIDEMENTPYQKFITLSKGLTYSVQIAATQQLYESPVLEKFKNPLIRTKAGNPLIKYTIGIFDSYDEARNLRYQLLKEGYKGAFITAYIDGIRKTRDQLRPLVDQYEGLRAYINVE